MHVEAKGLLDKVTANNKNNKGSSMKIITISQSFVSKLRQQTFNPAAVKVSNANERRIHADRRKEQRFGDTVDRRS